MYHITLQTIPNRYHLKWLVEIEGNIHTIFGRPHVEFITTNNHSSSSSSIALPNPRFISIHTAVAHMIHESGVVEYMYRIPEILSACGPSTDEPLVGI